MDCFTLILLMSGAVAMACAALPPLILLLPPLLWCALKCKRFVSKTMTQLKRLEGTARSPVLSCFAASLDGLVPIRAYGVARAQHPNLLGTLDRYARAYFFWLVLNRYLGLALDALCALFLVFLVAVAIALRGLVPPELPAIASASRQLAI